MKMLAVIAGRKCTFKGRSGKSIEEQEQNTTSEAFEPGDTSHGTKIATE